MALNDGYAADFDPMVFDGTLNSFGAKIAEPDSVYAFHRMQAKDEPPAVYRPADGFVNYADPEPSGAPGFVRSRDLLTLDPDPFGTRTEAWAQTNGLPHDSNYVPGLSVFGRPMSRGYLMQSDAGKRLVELEEKKRRGEKRSFIDAVTDFELSDLPFLSLFASVGKSVGDAVTVSNTMRKLQNGEPVTDDELIKTRLYMAENEYRENGTWGSTVGDIVRAAPGFMTEFALSGGLYSAARVGASKALGRGIHLGLTRATKRFGREMVESTAKETVERLAKEGTEGFTEGFAKGLASITTDGKLRKDLIDTVSNDIFSKTMWDDAAGTALNPFYKGLTRDQVYKLATDRAEYELEKLTARSGLATMPKAWHSFSQWLGQSTSRGLLDFGAWGTEEASVLFRKSTAGQQLADAVGTLLVEAPVKGALLQLPGQLARYASGAVSKAQLSLQQSAYLQGNKELMDDAESIAFGINLLEYASENAGRAFKPLTSVIGTGVNRLGVSKLLKPVSGMIHAGSDLVRDTDRVKFGGRMRQWVDDVFGTRESFRAKMANQRSKLVLESLAGQGITVADRAELDAALMSGVTSRLAPDVQAVVGKDIRKYADNLVEAAFKSGRKDLEYKSMARYMVADFMTRRNIGPQTIMNMYEKMGYDGVLGEMLEERYNDVAKGLLGLDDKAEHDFWSNFKEAVKGLYPGFDQLTAEAVGFMVPMVTRAGMMRLTSSIGGEGKYREVRTMLEGFGDIHRHARTVELKLDTFRRGHASTLALYDTRLDETRKALDAAREAGDVEKAKGLEANIKSLETARDNRAKTYNDSIASVESAARKNAEALNLINGDMSEDETAKVVGQQTVVVEPMLSQDVSGMQYNLRPVHDPEHSRQGLVAQTAVVDYAPELAKLLWEAEVPLEGETPSLFRTVARKVVGFAGTLVTGDISLMSTNPVQWNARDMGLDRSVCIALKNGYRAEWDRNRQELEKRIRAAAVRGDEAGSTLQLTRKQVTDLTDETFRGKARAIMTAYLASHQLRSASQSQMLEQAVDLVARSKGYSGTDSNGRLIRFTPDGSETPSGKLFDDNAPTAVRFYEENKEEIDKVRDRIAMATLDIMSNRTTVGVDAQRGLINLVRLPAFAKAEHGRKTPEVDAIEDHMVYTAALQMSGMQGLVTSVTADGNVPLNDLIAQQAASSVNMDIVRYVADAARLNHPDSPDLSGVDRRALESIAKAMNIRFDGTQASLDERDAYILNLCLQAVELDNPNVRFFSAPITRDEAASRLSRGDKATVRAMLTDGGWVLAPESRDKNGEVITLSPMPLDSLISEMNSRGFSEASQPKAVFTQARVFEAADPIVMLRELNLLREYMKLLESANQDGEIDYMHPLLQRDEDGKWKYEEDSPELRAAFADDLAIASGYDPRLERVVSRPKGASEKTVADTYQRVFGPRGYITIAEKLLRAHGVAVSDEVATRAGRFDPYSAKRYSMVPSVWRSASGSADIYIPIDFSIAQDYSEAMLNAKLLDAYATHPELLRGSLGGTLSDFTRQLDALVVSAIVDAHDRKDAALEAELRAFQLRCTSAVDRMDADGNIYRGAGVSAQSFATMASTFALFQVERKRDAGTNVTDLSRALAVIAEDARRLPAYKGFVSLVDLALGGNGFAAQELSSETLELSRQRGLQRVMSVFSGKPDALQRAVAATVPGGLTYEQFLHGCNQFLQQKARVPYVSGSLSSTQVEDLRRKAANASASPAADAEFFTSLVTPLGIKQEDLTRFFTDVVEFVKSQPDFVPGNPDVFNRIADLVARSKDYAEADRQQAEMSRELEMSRQSVAALEQKLRDRDVRLAQITASNAANEQDVANLRAEIAALRSEIESLKPKVAENRSRAAEAAGKANEIRSVTKGGATPSFLQNLPSGFSMSVNLGQKAKHRRINDSRDPEDQVPVGLYVGAGSTTEDLPAMFAAEDGLAQLVGLDSDLRSECYGITSAQARLMCNIAVRIAIAQGTDVNRSGIDGVVRTLFPSIKDSDLLYLLDQFDQFDVMREKSGRSWDEISAESGAAWTSVEEDLKNETDSANDGNQFNRSAVDEYNNKELKNFLAIAQIMSPETRRNFQALALNMREVNRRVVDALDRTKGIEESATGAQADYFKAARFLYRLLNPRANTEGKTFNDRQAYHVLDLRLFDTDPDAVYGHIAALAAKGKDGTPFSRKGAVLLSYLMTLPRGTREQFMQLIANSAVCTPVRTSEKVEVDPETGFQRTVKGAFTPLQSAARRHYAVSTDMVTASFTKLIGMSTQGGAKGRKSQIAELLEDVARISPELMLGKNRDQDATLTASDMNLSDGRLKAIMDMFAERFVAPVFGRETPLYSALVSPSFHRYYRNLTAAEQNAIATMFSRDRKFGSIPFVELLKSVLVALDSKTTKGPVTSYDIEVAATAVIATGFHNWADVSGVSNPSTASGTETPLYLLLASYENSLPETIMNAEIDSSRETRESSVAIASRGVVPLVSRWIDSKDGFDALCRKFFPQAAGDERLMARCRQDMTWPDPVRTPILAKSISKSYTAAETLAACIEGFYDKSSPVYYVPVFAGDHSSSVLLQLPKTIDVSVPGWKPSGALPEARQKWVLSSKEYFTRADGICRNLGLELLWDDTKRSALSSLEAPGIGMYGIKVEPDGSEKKGTCKVGVLINMSEGATNEEMVGTTGIYGYGAERIMACAKNPESSTLKVHLAGTGGDFVAFIKSLANTKSTERGVPLAGSALAAYGDIADSVLGKDADISSLILTDLDSYKVGPALSKTVRVVDSNGKKHKILDFMFAQLRKAFPDMDAAPDSLSTEELSQMIGDARIVDSTRAKGSNEFDLVKVLPNVELRKVDGFNGTTYMLVYDQPDTTAYTVANVSHEALPELLRTPANHIADAFTMAEAQSKSGSGMSDRSRKDLYDVIGNWGEAAVSLNIAPETLYNIYHRALTRDAESSGIAALRAAGENVQGQFILDEVSKTVYAKNRKDAAIPLNAIYAPLVACGASCDSKGNVFCQAKSRMIRDLVKGPQVFTNEEAAFYGSKVRRGLCGINCRTNSFRYGWFLDEAKFRSVFASDIDKHKELPPARAVAKAMADVFIRLRELEKSYSAQSKGLREAIFACFLDHHGTRLSESYNKRRIDTVCFEDLFRDSPTGTRVFDLSAVQCEPDDLVFNDGTGERHIFLGGTLMGLPRTPSYNGSMWAQQVRAGLPVDEIEETDEDGNVTYKVGKDAKVSPDPVTNKILGCDHDGDKAAIYMYDSKAGLVDFWVPPARRGDESVDDYRSRLLSEVDGSKDPYVEVDEETGGYRFSDNARHGVSNTMVRSLFDLGAGMTEAFTETGDVRRSYLGLPLSDDGDSFTKADPLGSYKDPVTGASRSKLEDRILNVYGAKSLVEGRNLGELLTAIDVTDASNDANESRAKSVSLARSLHVMYASGAFKDSVMTEDPQVWLRFMYRFDGISNATFDDIKNQKCARLGWTSGMMKALTADILAYRYTHGELPQTDEEWEGILVNYTKDIYEKGARYYMVANTTVAPKRAAAEIQQSIAKRLGRRGQKLEKLLDPKSLDDAGQLLRDVINGITVEDTGVKSARDLQYLLTHVTQEDALGWVYHLFLQAEKAVENGATESNREALHAELVEFVRWYSAGEEITLAEKLSKSVYYPKADPGDASESGKRNLIVYDNWVLFHKVKKGSIDYSGEFLSLMNRMHRTNGVLHDIGARLESVKARAIRASHSFAVDAVKLLQDSGTAGIAARLLSLPRVPQTSDGQLTLEANAQQAPYVIAALARGGDIFLSGKTRSKQDLDLNQVSGGVYGFLESIAKEVAKVRRKGDGSDFTVMDLRKGIEDAFDLMYRLAASSTESFRNSAFMYLHEVPDNAFSSVYAGGGLRRITAMLRESTLSQQQHAREMVARIIEGKDFAGERKHRNANKSDGVGTFALTTESLDALVKEGGAKLSGTIEIARALVKAVEASQKGPAKKGVTPAVMFGQLLPIYTLVTSRTLGTPQPTSPSFLSLVPKRVYEALSTIQVELDQRFGTLMNAVIAREIGPTRNRPLQPQITSQDIDAFQNSAQVMANAPSDQLQEYVGGLETFVKPRAVGKTPEGKDMVLYSETRGNPDRRNTFDIFAAGGVFRDIAARINSVDPMPKDPSPGRDLGDILSGASRGTEHASRPADERTRTIATALGAALGSWAKVEYNGGQSFTLRGRLSGDAGQNTEAVIVVDVPSEAFVRDENQLRSLANSYAFASSVVSCANLGMSADMFLELPLETRVEFARKFTVGGASTQAPVWSMDGRGIATLVGGITLTPGAKGSVVYHEFFHQMCSMFRHLRLWGVEDIRALREEFGDPPPGTGTLFNEEAAAERFRKFVMSQAAPDSRKDEASGVRNIFQKIYDFLKGLLEILRLGYEYGTKVTPTDETLFKMMLHGVAERTTSSKRLRGKTNIVNSKSEVTDPNTQISFEELGVVDEESYSVTMSILGQLSGITETKASLDRSSVRETTDKEGRTRVLYGPTDEAALIDETRKNMANAMENLLGNKPPAEDYSGPIDGSDDVTPEMFTEWDGICNSLTYALKTKAPLSTVRDLSAKAAEVRKRMADAAGVDLNTVRSGETEPEGALLQVAPLGTDEYKSEVVRAAVHGGTFPGVDVNPFYIAGRAVTEACIRGLNSEGSWQNDLKNAIKHFANQGNRGDLDEAANKQTVLQGVRMVMQQVNPAYAAKIRNTEIEQSLVFETCLAVHQHLKSSFVTQDGYADIGSYINSVDPDAKDVAERKANATAYDYSAWCLVSHSVRPSEHTEACLDKLHELKRSAGSGSKAAIQFLIDKVSRIDAMVSDQTKLADYVNNAREAILQDVLPSVVAGLTKPMVNERGYLEDYRLNTSRDASLSKLSQANFDRYSKCIGDRSVQEAVKTTVQTLFTCAAEIKFYRETGITPCSAADLDAVEALSVDAPVKSPGDSMADLAIGPGHLLEDEALIDYYDQGYFIGNNVSKWLDSQLRKSFNGVEIRDIITQNEHEFESLASEGLAARNFLARLLGFDTEPGGKLLRVIDVEDEFSMEHGVVRHSAEGRKAKGFDNYGKNTCGIEFTEDEYRTVRWYADMLKAWANGERELITGLDRLTFDAEGTRTDPVYYRLERIKARQDRGERLTRFENLLLRIPEQLNETVWGNSTTDPATNEPIIRMGLYDRLVNAVCTTARKIAEEAEPMDRFYARDEALKQFRTPDGRSLNDLEIGTAEYNEAAKQVNQIEQGIIDETNTKKFNSRMLRALETKGLIAVQSDDNGNVRAGVVVLRNADVERMFTNSSAYKKLTGKDGGRNYQVEIDGRSYHCLSKEALIKPLMDVWRRTCTFVKQHPWVTEGDARTLNTFNTPLPMFTGTGYFMANAVRKARDAKRDYTKNLGRYEKTFLGMLELSAKHRKERLSDMSRSKALKYVEQIGDLFGLPEDDAGLLNALIQGQYAETTEASHRYGLTLGADPTLDELVDTIYGRLCEKSWEQDNRPFKRDKVSSVDNMIDAYRDSRMADMSVTTHPTGITARRMYEKYGILPANFDLGHAVKVAIEQVTNSVMQRNTLASLILTPSADGTPVYYARPSDVRAEQRSLPDDFWGSVARWWADINGIEYDEKLSGVDNARAIYDKIHAARGKSGTVKSRNGETHVYKQLPKDASDLVSIDDWLVQDDEDLGGESTMLNALGGGEAMGYLKQVCGAGRVLGIGGPLVRATLHRGLAWSKAMSVSFSMFFPLATKWESPIAAVGAMATLGSNYRVGSKFLRAHPDLANGITKLFPGSGWITKDFLGFSDIVQMMDSHSPFMAELVAWTHALGISLSSAEANPMEPQKSVMLDDIKRLKQMLKDHGMSDVAARFGKVTDALVTRQSEKAFTYALNATKMACVAQLAMKLRHEAAERGKAFDPIRDLRKYAGYINAEVGGIDQKRYAWAHPMNRGIMNTLMFSWEWTRGAWEAGGGGVIEDLVFGGHSYTKEERKFMLGRWVRMFGEVMIGVPLLMQFLVKLSATMLNAVTGAPDDDDDPWATWDNEDKSKWTAFNLTPLLRALNNVEFIRTWKADPNVQMYDRFITGLLGGGTLGARLGGIGGAAVGGAAGALAANALDMRTGRLIPAYTGDDPANQTTRNRKYYMHFGKQGWEFFRWFDEPGKQFFSKLSMPTQRLLEGFVGRNMSWLDKELPWEDMGALERWADPTVNGAAFNMLKAWIPFTVNGLGTFGDAGFLSAVGPVSMGASRTAINDRLKTAVAQWAKNDRRGYAFGTVRRSGKRSTNLAPLVQDILHDAKMNGEVDLDRRLANAIGQVMSDVYNRLFKALPRNPGEDFDAKEIEACCRTLNRLGARLDDVMRSVKSKLKDQHRDWKSNLTEDQRRMYLDLIRTGLRGATDVKGEMVKMHIDY